MSLNFRTVHSLLLSRIRVRGMLGILVGSG